MRFRTSLFFLTLIFCLPLISAGQVKYYQRDTTVKVFAYGKEQTLAWCGGFNTPQFSMGDINNDGLPDLVVFEPWNSTRTFLNMGTPGHPDYRYRPEYANNFPAAYDYLILQDYNRDGIPDFFHQGPVGFEVWKGYYNSANQLCFNFYQDLFYTNDANTHGPANAFTNPTDIPAIVDVDGDGDLDFIAYNIVGGQMNWYRNLQVEMGLPKDSIHIALWDECWGKVYQGFFRTHTLQFSCQADNSSLDHSFRVAGGGSEKKTHSGNTPCLFDWDMDGDMDYLDGSVSFNEMTFLKNGRIEAGGAGPDSMISQDTMWQSFAGGTQIEIPTWPAAFNLDVDQDGKKDLVIAPNLGGFGSKNYNNIWYYKNLTTPGAPNWQFQSDSFLCDMTIDLGNGAFPMLFDFDKDGLPDMFIGSDGYYQPDGSLKSRISYYKNTGTRGNPQYTLITNDFLGTSAYNFTGTSITFGDIDNDGKADMIVGHTDGTLSFFKNWASSDSVEPIWQLMELELTDVNGDTISVDGRAAPFIYDIDKDGKKDLVIGNVYGTLVYYQNTGTTAGNVQLKLINSQLGHFSVDPKQNYGNYSSPFFGRIDSTGVDYLLVGSNSGNIYEYTGFQSGDTTATYTMLDSQFSYIDSCHNEYAEPGTVGGIYGNMRKTVVVGDMGNDGSFEMILGDIKGGVELYRWQSRSTVEVPQVAENGHILVYPNPANDLLTVSWSGVIQQNVQISIINMEGQLISSITAPASPCYTSLPVKALPDGMYICQVESGANRYYSKFSVMK
jgi:hypothetical protein